MKNLLIILTAFLCAGSSLLAQPAFTIDASPLSITVQQGDTARFGVEALPTGGFSASVYLDVEATTCLPGVTFSSTVMNPPYTGDSLTIAFDTYINAGTYQIIVVGENGPVVDRDTVYLTVLPASPEWEVYEHFYSGIPFDYIRALEFDNQGRLWFGGGLGAAPNSFLGYYDGTNWVHWQPFKPSTITTDYCGDTLSQTPFLNHPHASPVHELTLGIGGNMWYGGEGGGIGQYSGTSFNFYDTLNSGYIDAFCYAIEFDSAGKLWAGSPVKGMVFYDGTTWTPYNTANSIIPSNEVHDLQTDTLGYIWVATNGGMARFDGTFWSIYNTSNSNLPSNDVRDIAIDPQNDIKWIANGPGGLVKLDGNNFTVYSPGQNGFPFAQADVHRVKVDAYKNVWINTSYGLAKFDGTNWLHWDVNNSGFPPANNYTPTPQYESWGWALALDSLQNPWFSSFGGGLAHIKLNLTGFQPAFAGADTSLCGSSGNLNATPLIGTTGTWTQVSGAPATIVSPNDPQTTLLGLAAGNYAFAWTSTSPSTSDTVLVVVLPAPNAFFIASPQGTGAYQFTDNSTGNILSWFWDFGDGNTSTQQNPTHNYAQGGNYLVCLTVTDSSGCQDTRCETTTFVHNDSEIFGLQAELFPNPNQGEFRLRFEPGSQGSSTQIQLYSLEGKLVWEKFSSFSGEEIKLRIPGEIRNGIYLLQVERDEKRGVFRMQLQR